LQDLDDEDGLRADLERIGFFAWLREPPAS
jgi:hypothetical protein